MDWFYNTFVELTATQVENMVALGTVTAAAGRKYRGWKHIALLLALSGCSTIIIAVMNRLSAFSFATPLVAMAFVSFVSSQITSGGSLLVRCTSGFLAYIVIQSVDYILFVLMGQCVNVPQDVFTVLMTPGPLRACYLFLDKLSDVILYCFLRKKVGKLSALTKKMQFELLGLSLSSYAFMQYLFGTIMTADLVVMQLGVVFSWLFVLCFIAAMLALFNSLTKAEHDRQAKHLLQSENALMEENYRQLHKTQQAHARQLHDFKHHLLAIKGLASAGKQSDIGGYVDKLLETSYQEAAVCHSGNDTIDAIINCKAAEAGQENISFTFTANFPVRTNIEPTDLCGVLANQIDNALEACRELPDSGPRGVAVEVYQNENFAFFRVENTVEGDPFENNPRLLSTKKDASQLHGLGLKNIREIAEKYDGSLRNEYRNGRFLSVASLSFEPMEDFDGK